MNPSNRNYFDAYERVIYEKLKAALKPDGIVPTKSFLRQDVALSNNQAQYQFNFQAPSGNNANNLPERYLATVDGFYAYAIGLFLSRETTAEQGGNLLQTYPNKTVFPTAAGFNPDDLAVVYNGSVQFAVNNSIIMRYLPTLWFLDIPETQQGEVSAAIAGPVTYPLDFSQHNPSQGFVQLMPDFTMSGDASNMFTVTLPTWSGIEIASVVDGVKNNLSLVLLGFDIPNGAKSINNINW